MITSTQSDIIDAAILILLDNINTHHRTDAFYDPATHTDLDADYILDYHLHADLIAADRILITTLHLNDDLPTLDLTIYCDDTAPYAIRHITANIDTYISTIHDTTTP